MIGAQRVDFVAIPVTDKDRAMQFYDSGVCHMAFFKDPDGNGLMLHHRYAPYSDRTSP